MPIFPRAWVIAAMLTALQIINFFDKTVLGLAAAPMMRDLGLSPTEFGALGSLFFSLYWLSGLAVGLFVIQRAPSKWLLAGLVAIWTLAQAPVVFTSSFLILGASRVMLGVGEGPATASAWHTLYEWFDNERRATPTAIVNLGPPIAAIIGAPLLIEIIQAFGWRAAFGFCSAIGLVWLVLWLIVARPGPLALVRPASFAGASGTRPAAISARQFWLDKTIVGSTIVAMCSYWPVVFGAIWLPAYLQKGLGFDARATGFILAGAAFGNGAAALGFARLSTLLMTRGFNATIARGLVNSLVVLAAAIFLLIAAFAPAGVGQLLSAAIGLGLPTVTFTLGPTIVADVAPAPRKGAALLVVYTLATLIGLVTPVVVGRLIQAAGPERMAQGFAQAFLLSAIVVGAGALAGLALLRPDQAKARFAAPTA